MQDELSPTPDLSLGDLAMWGTLFYRAIKNVICCSHGDRYVNLGVLRIS